MASRSTGTNWATEGVEVSRVCFRSFRLQAPPASRLERDSFFPAAYRSRGAETRVDSGITVQGNLALAIRSSRSGEPAPALGLHCEHGTWENCDSVWGGTRHDRRGCAAFGPCGAAFRSIAGRHCLSREKHDGLFPSRQRNSCQCGRIADLLRHRQTQALISAALLGRGFADCRVHWP